MIFSKTKQAATRTWFAQLPILLTFISLTSTWAVAQQTGLEQLTKENLIGKAVSFSNNDYKEIDKAIQRFRNGDSGGALEFLKTAKEKYPKLPPVDTIYAKMHFVIRSANAVKAGRVLLERSVVNNPADPEAYLILADQAFAGRRITEAHALFNLADPLVQKFSENTKRKQDFTIRLLAGRAAVAESRRQWDQAQKWLEQWVEVAPESAAAHQRLGGTLFQNGKPKEALGEFSKARKLNAEVPHPYVALAQMFSRAGDVGKAQKAFEKAYAENKNDVKTARSYAEWLIQQGSLDQAQAIAEALLGQAPDSVTALLLDGIVAQMQGQAGRAKQAMTKIISLDPSHFTATNLLALLLIQSDEVADHERALKYAEMNSRNFPKSPGGNITRAWILYRLGRTAEFQAALQKVGRNQVPLDSAFLIAKIMVEQDKKEAAIKELERLLQAKSGLFVFRREAGELLKKLQAE
ncbi:MAG: tetratricopeptide repeat protein [Planctomycetes bacterium]|nr:tetratricopeptide repeat protein [Planctomycetota bacterium]